VMCLERRNHPKQNKPNVNPNRDRDREVIDALLLLNKSNCYYIVMDDLNEIRNFMKEILDFKNTKQYYNLNQKLKKNDDKDIITQLLIYSYKTHKLNERLMKNHTRMTKKCNSLEEEYLDLLGKEGFYKDKIEQLTKELDGR